MTKMNLCSACERHVYADEPACPFCGSAEPRLPVAEPLSQGRLSRAATHAARAAILVGAVACSKPQPQADAAIAVDGAVMEDAATAEDAGSPEDAGPTDATVADAQAPDGGDAGYIPIYGGVFPDPRKRAIV